MSEILDIHRPFIDWLNEQRVPFVNSRSDRESTIAEGHPDFTLMVDNRVLLLEMKTEKGKLSSAQVKRIAYLEAAGCKVHVVRDIGAAIELVTAWLGMMPLQAQPVGGHEKHLDLVLWGDGVFRRGEGGAMIHVRKATPADSMLRTM